jgi:hypothetical protein
MTTPTTSSVKTAADWFEKINDRMVQLRRHYSVMSSRMGAQDLSGDDFLRSIYVAAIRMRELIKAGVSAANLNLFAQEQFNDGTLDYVVEITATRVALDNLIAQIVTDMPVSNPGTWVSIERLDPDLSEHVGDPLNADGIEERMFTPAQMATVKGLVDAVIGTIDAPV